MTILTRLIAPTFAVVCLAGGVAAQSADPAVDAAIKARHAHMDLLAYNLGTLGGMAQDKIPYDATLASAAAANLAALSHMDWTSYWVAGSEAGMAEGSRALPAIWTGMEDFHAKQMAMATAADAMAAAAGTDLDALKAAMGPLGGACGDCHKTYRQPNN